MDTKAWIIIELAHGLKVITRPKPGETEAGLRESMEACWGKTAFIRWARNRYGWPCQNRRKSDPERSRAVRSGFVWWSGRPVGYTSS